MNPLSPPHDFPLSALVAHADWSAAGEKRWLALAILEGGDHYRCLGVEPAGDPRRLLRRLKSEARSAGALLIGFDFPIGLPLSYARRAGIDDFLAWLPQAGAGRWSDFFHVAETPAQVSLERPFYPLKPGLARQEHLTAGLGIEMHALRRLCEIAHPGRRAAAPLFWTLGPQQVGKAAIAGWQEVLLAPGPTLAGSIWPFAGRLPELLQPGRTVLVETYPAEYYARLGVAFSPPRRGQRSGKGVQADRAANAGRLFAWADQVGVELDQRLITAIQAGFGDALGGDDRFDAVIGLFAMLAMLRGFWEVYEPPDDPIRKIEGWILGQSQPVAYNESHSLA